MQSLVASNSETYTVKNINYELKREIPNEFRSVFRIVVKDGLIVRDNKKVNSNINGILNSKDIIKIVEKNKNWTYIEFTSEDDEFIEGWVFTRYLKQIK